MSFYILVNLCILIFIYGVQKLSSLFYFRQLKGYLDDLESGYLESPDLLKNRRIKMRRIFIGLGIFLLSASILGLLRAMGVI